MSDDNHEFRRHTFELAMKRAKKAEGLLSEVAAHAIDGIDQTIEVFLSAGSGNQQEREDVLRNLFRLKDLMKEHLP